MELNLDLISHQKYSFELDGPKKSIQVEVNLPDFKKLKSSVWGDWGPMYTFELSDEQAVGVKYNDTHAFNIETQLCINSPIFAIERREHPFYIIIEDEEKKLKFNLYIDNDYQLGKVEAVSDKEKVKIFENQKAFVNQDIFAHLN